MATKNIKFKQGDLVFVERKIERRSKDWRNLWADGMDKYVGNTYTVRYHDINGVYFEEDDGCFGFPPKGLRLIKSGTEYYFKKGDIVEVVKAMPEHRVWVKEMEDSVGGAYVVDCLDSDNTLLLSNVGGRNLWFPCEAVKLVGKESKYKNAPKPKQPEPEPAQPIVLEAWEKF